MNNPKLNRRIQQLESEGYPNDILYVIIAEEFPQSIDKELIYNDFIEQNNQIYEEMKAIGMIPIHELISQTNLYTNGEAIRETNEANEGEETKEGEETEERESP
jgi:hypothetical protein